MNNVSWRKWLKSVVNYLMKKSILKRQGYVKNKSLENEINLQRVRGKDMIQEYNALSVGWGRNSLGSSSWYVSLRNCVLTVAPMLTARKPVYACVPNTEEQRQRSLTSSLVSQSNWNGNLRFSGRSCFKGIKRKMILCLLPSPQKYAWVCALT